MANEIQIIDLASLRKAFIARRHELGLTQLQVDHIAGLQDGYTGKIEAGIKNLGPVSLGCLLGALKLKMAVRPAD